MKSFNTLKHFHHYYYYYCCLQCFLFNYLHQYIEQVDREIRDEKYTHQCDQHQSSLLTFFTLTSIVEMTSTKLLRPISLCLLDYLVLSCPTELLLFVFLLKVWQLSPGLSEDTANKRFEVLSFLHFIGVCSWS